MTISIRNAQDGDVDFLFAMNQMVHELHLSAEPAYFKSCDPQTVKDLFRSRLRQPKTNVWIAEIHGEATGYAVSVLCELPETALCSARRFTQIEELGVPPAHRRSGVARALVQHVLAETRAQGIDDVQLTSWCFNSEAHAAFQALGFRPMILRFQHNSGCQPRA